MYCTTLTATVREFRCGCILFKTGLEQITESMQNILLQNFSSKTEHATSMFQHNSHNKLGTEAWKASIQVLMLFFYALLQNSRKKARGEVSSSLLEVMV